LFQNGFPNNLSYDVSRVAELIPFKAYNNISIGTSEQSINYTQDGVLIKFPYRIYYIDVKEEVIDKLSLQQKMILHCIYSRSCDGFIRQKHIQALLQMDYEDWAIPYIVKVSDEYVMEILEMIYDILKEQDTERIRKFCFENTQSFCKSYGRMVSYWNEFYRYRCYNYRNYIGRKLFIKCFGYSRSLEKRKLENI
jgi:hypothetical protein